MKKGPTSSRSLRPLIGPLALSLTCALLLTAVPLRANANTLASVYVFSTSNPYGALVDDDSVFGSPGQAVETSRSIANGGPVFSSVPPFPPVGMQVGTAYAFASSAEGALRASVRSNAETAGLVQNAIANDTLATATWSDGLTVDAPGLTGELGYITFEMDIEGFWAGSIGPYGLTDNSSLNLAVRIRGTSMPEIDYLTIQPSLLQFLCAGSAYCARQFSGYGPFPGGSTVSSASYSNIPQTVSLTLPVVFGTETGLYYSLEMSVTPSASTFATGSGTSGAGFASYVDTGITWGGITGVFRADDSPVLSFTTSSTSGFDYSQPAPVPEPGFGAMIVGGLCALTMLARARSHAGAGRRTRRLS